MHNDFLSKVESFYMIGIGGVSMSSLAKYLVYKGKRVGGFDRCMSERITALQEMGLIITTGETVREEIVNYDVVVYTDAVREDDILLKTAEKLNKEILSRGQLLYEVSRGFQTVIGVAGSHGKTTTTAMLAHIFDADCRKFAAHIGGEDLTFSNFYACGNDYFITEACEYRKNFLLLKPDLSIVLNSSPDHLECYGCLENLKKAYISFAQSASNHIVLYGDLPCGGITFGFDMRADYHVAHVKKNDEKYRFTLIEKGHALGEIALNVYGKHNILNALACSAAARSLGIEFSAIKEGLENFRGVKRRFEWLGTLHGADCIADYAHHPDEMKVTIRTALKLTNGRLFVVFQPHTYSRTRILFSQFVNVLSPVKNLLIYRTFAAREYYDDKGSAFTLSKAVKKSRYAESMQDLENFLTDVCEKDKVLFLGAGDIYDLALTLLQREGELKK